METIPAEYYMVWDNLWASSGLPRRNMYLCVGCFESILGRKLIPDDFAPVETNQPHETMSDRLLNRMGLERVVTNDDGEVIDWPGPELTYDRNPPLVDDMEWFGAQSATGRLGVALSTLIRLVLEGRISALWQPLRIRREDLDSYIESLSD